MRSNKPRKKGNTERVAMGITTAAETKFDKGAQSNDSKDPEDDGMDEDQDNKMAENTENERIKLKSKLQQAKDQDFPQVAIKGIQDLLDALPAPTTTAFTNRQFYTTAARVQTWMDEEREEWNRADKVMKERLELPETWIAEGKKRRGGMRAEHEEYITKVAAKLKELEEE